MVLALDMAETSMTLSFSHFHKRLPCIFDNELVHEFPTYEDEGDALNMSAAPTGMVQKEFCRIKSSKYCWYRRRNR